MEFAGVNNKSDGDDGEGGRYGDFRFEPHICLSFKLSAGDESLEDDFHFVKEVVKVISGLSRTSAFLSSLVQVMKVLKMISTLYSTSAHLCSSSVTMQHLKDNIHPVERVKCNAT